MAETTPLNPDPFDEWSDEELYDAHLALALACGRAKSVLRQKHRGRLCALMEITAAESDKRRVPVPHAPYKA